MNLGHFSIAAMHEKVSSLPLSQRIWLFVGTFLLLVCAFYFLQYRPQSENIAKLQADLSEQEKQLAILKRAAAELPALQESLAKAEGDFAYLLSQLPDKKEIPALLETVSQLGAQVGLENVLFQPQPEQTFEFYAVIPIRLDLVGTYHKLGAFFDNMSKLNRILKVENLSLTRARGGSALQVSCTIVTYRFLEKPSEAQGAPKSK
jgi:type IV pilus assembly protein PilO